MSTILSWIPLAISVVLFLGATAAYLRGSRDKGTIDTLTRNNTALAERVGLLERAESILTTRVGTLERENSVLRDIVTSAQAISDLTFALTAHHTESMDRFDNLQNNLEGHS